MDNAKTQQVNRKSNFLVFILVLLVHISLSFPASAQFVPAKVERSNNIIELNGQKYYLHEVKAKQTLFSICQAYGVSTKVVGQENPIIKLGELNEGQILKIPYVEITQAIDSNSKDLDNYIYHIVEPKQTLSAISRKYNIPVQDLIGLNPGVDVVLPVGKEIMIPRIRLSMGRTHTIQQESSKFKYHKVQPKETLFSLSRTYGVKVSEIKAANPGLKWGLSLDEVIRIPIAKGMEPGQDTTNQPLQITGMKMDSIFNQQGFEQAGELNDLISPDLGRWLTTSASEECGSLIELHTDTQFEIAFLLPLYVTANDTLHLNDTLPYARNDIYRDAVRFLEYLEGALLAIDSLRQAGLSMNVHIFDTERNPNTVRELVTSGQLNHMDLIFGPVYPETLEIVSVFSRLRKIPLISPLSSRGIGIEDNPYLFQVNPTEQMQHDLASIYLSRFYDKNILLIKDTNDINNQTNRYSSNIKNYLTYKINPTDLRYRQILFTDKDRSVSMDDSLAFRLEDVLSLTRDNLVVIPSTNKVFVADIINRLNNLSLHYDITVFGNPQWGQFDALQLESLYKLNLHYYTNFSNPYVNYTDPLTLDFCKKYRLNFNNEPDRFSFQGFDVTFYFIKALFLFGSDFIDHVDCWPEVLIHPTRQTNFHFVRKGMNGGYENQALSIVRYNQESLIKERISSTTFMNPE